jgi:hypothetical protein
MEKEHGVKEKKIVYKDGDEVRVLRGTIFKEDDFFIYVHRLDGDQRIGKSFIIRIEEGNNELPRNP